MDKNHPDNAIVLDAHERLEFDLIVEHAERKARDTFLAKFFVISTFALVAMAVITCSL